MKLLKNMLFKSSKYLYYLFYLLIIVISYIILYCLLYQNNKIYNYEIYDRKSNISHLQNNGFVVIKNCLSNSETNHLLQKARSGNYKEIKTYLIQHPKINDEINGVLESNGDYIFQDYIWVIQKSKVHTCHRDNNGSFFNEGQKYPSYTMLVYLEDMEKCLGVIPKSHLDKNSYNFNMTNPIENVTCQKGDIILFNANLIHVGTLLNKSDHVRIQMKVTHKDDIETLAYYQNFNKILNKDNTLHNRAVNFQYNISCMFPYVSNLTQGENIKTAGGTSSGADIGFFQKLYSYLFYSDSNFYDLPNAF